MTNPYQREVSQELTGILYRSLYIGLIGIILQATLVLWLLHDVINHRYLHLWYLILVSDCVIGLFSIIWYNRTKHIPHLQPYHHFFYVIGSSLAALLMGLLGSVLMPAQIAYQMVIMLIIVGIVGAAIQTLHASYTAAITYLTLSIGPMLIWVAAQASSGNKIYMSILIILLTYSIYLCVDVYSGHKVLVNNILLKISNISNVKELEDQKKKIHALSIRDPLTGLYNRRYLTTTLNNLFSEKRKFSIGLLDLDHFKSINDKYGHASGDMVLVDFTTCLQQYFDDVDHYLFRFGGEEFIVILCTSKKNEATVHFNAFKKYLQKCHFCVDRTNQLTITFSAGIATYPEDGKDASTLIAAADGALYYSKQHGRNLITTV